MTCSPDLIYGRCRAGLQYLCGMKWGMNMAMANEFGHGRCTAALNASCVYLLSANDTR